MFTNKTFATGFGFVFFLFGNQFCQSFVSTAGKEYHENVSKNRKWEWNTNREKSLVKITNRIINKISVRYFCYFSALFIAYPYSYGLTYRNNNGNWLLTLSLSTQIVTSVLSDLLNFLWLTQKIRNGWLIPQTRSFNDLIKHLHRKRWFERLNFSSSTLKLHFVIVYY